MLKGTTRGQDVICPYGGEEFAIVLGCASLGPVRKRAELLREEIKQLDVRPDGRLFGAVAISIGIAVLHANGDTVEQLLKAAEDAIFRAKEEGRARIIVP